MAPSLDGRTFVLVSSTASEIDAADPTRFRYREREGVLWGDYRGGVVAEGRFVGVRDDALLDVRFVHRLRDGGLVEGSARSRIEGAAPALRLVEQFEADGRPQTSICVEAEPDATSTSAG